MFKYAAAMIEIFQTKRNKEGTKLHECDAAFSLRFYYGINSTIQIKIINFVRHTSPFKTLTTGD
jgi:hypothetical protein